MAVTKSMMANASPNTALRRNKPEPPNNNTSACYQDAATTVFSYARIKIENIRALKKDKTMVAR